eukprot:TRINITY_DN1783_c0_g1_i2.p1 TRINITY_DN1783_c0_g1~~TRINITY_DN1783_c0_g1_i2.p1  ORF type:complete len:149 (-),score=38.94 TRINITY_DN1783_c0_g1_i2:41-487(-)
MMMIGLTSKIYNNISSLHLLSRRPSSLKTVGIICSSSSHHHHQQQLFRPCLKGVTTIRMYTTHHDAENSSNNVREERMKQILVQGLETDDVNIIDLSGGCGAMYRIEVTSKKFKGKTIVNQHRMVNELLKDEIANMHGLTVKTSVDST